MTESKNLSLTNVSRETFHAPQPRPGVLAIDTYVPGKSAAPAGVKIHKLSSNETPFGPSPAAKQAYLDFVHHLELYPDGSAKAIRTAIGAHFNLDPTRIVCGAGSDELLALLANIYIGPGDEGILSEHGFLVYKIAILAAGGSPVIVPETNLTTNIDAILNSVTLRTKIIFIANPNNPTGTYLPCTEVKRLAGSLPQDVLLVLDGAYAEYAIQKDYSAGIELVSEYHNVVMTRTFSKVYGLAALRIGWCYAPAAICDALNRVRGPFNTNSAGSAAAIAALGDQAHIDHAIAHNTHWARWLTENLQKLGLTITPSAANFLLIHFKDTRQAQAADEFLTSRGLILRAVKAYGLAQCLRLTVGLEEANRLVVETLEEFLGTGSKPIA